ncbi:MAG: T9SS type A sorting domain-containing protein, partial [Bacteroidota bacterium]|nr:T9SS type A sorting domain-containing protein [Bacteroidota bacterium]
NGDCYIYGKFWGFIDENGEHPEQKMLVRIYAPDVAVNEVQVDPTQLAVHPNPGSDQVNITWNSKQNHPIRIEIYSMLGELLRSETASISPITVATHDLPAGCYSILLVHDRGSRAVKWIKE